MNTDQIKEQVNNKLLETVGKFLYEEATSETKDKICLEILKDMQGLIKENNIQNFIVSSSPNESSPDLEFTYQMEDDEKIHTFMGTIHLTPNE